MFLKTIYSIQEITHTPLAVPLIRKLQQLKINQHLPSWLMLTLTVIAFIIDELFLTATGNDDFIRVTSRNELRI